MSAKGKKPGAEADGHGAGGIKFKKGRKAHNAPAAKQFESIEELVQLVGSEPRRVLLNGQVVEMTRTERALRLQVDRAIAGKARDLADLLRMMIKHPDLAKSYKEVTVTYICGALANL